MKTLLEKAKSIKSNKINYRLFTDQDIDLVLAWLDGHINTTQMCKARKLNRLTGNYLYYCASVLKYAHQLRKIKISKL